MTSNGLTTRSANIALRSSSAGMGGMSRGWKGLSAMPSPVWSRAYVILGCAEEEAPQHRQNLLLPTGIPAAASGSTAADSERKMQYDAAR